MTEQKQPDQMHFGVAAVMQAVTDLKSDQRHGHFGYQYVSIDALLTAVRESMADANLSVHIDEQFDGQVYQRPVERADKPAPPSMQVVRYTFTLMHGDQPCRPPETMMMPADFTTPQKAQGVRSMALKYYLRSLFLLPIGEPDAEAQQRPAAPVSVSDAPDVPF